MNCLTTMKLRSGRKLPSLVLDTDSSRTQDNEDKEEEAEIPTETETEEEGRAEGWPGEIEHTFLDRRAVGTSGNRYQILREQMDAEIQQIKEAANKERERGIDLICIKGLFEETNSTEVNKEDPNPNLYLPETNVGRCMLEVKNFLVVQLSNLTERIERKIEKQMAGVTRKVEEIQEWVKNCATVTGRQEEGEGGKTDTGHEDVAQNQKKCI